MWCFVQFSLYKIIKRKVIDNYGGKKEFFFSTPQHDNELCAQWPWIKSKKIWVYILIIVHQSKHW